MNESHKLIEHLLYMRLRAKRWSPPPQPAAIVSCQSFLIAFPVFIPGLQTTARDSVEI